MLKQLSIEELLGSYGQNRCPRLSQRSWTGRLLPHPRRHIASGVAPHGTLSVASAAPLVLGWSHTVTSGAHHGAGLWFTTLCALSVALGALSYNLMAVLAEVTAGDRRRHSAGQSRTYLHGVDVTASRFLQLPPVLAAVDFAAAAHGSQLRKTGEPYISHCIETALIVEACLPPAHSAEEQERHVSCIMAAVLHDVIDDTPTDPVAMTAAFGPGVAGLVEQVSKLSQMNQLLRRGKRQGWAQYSPSHFKQLRKLIVDLAFAEPLVILVKLADRLHNMRTVYVLQPDKQAAVAEETMEVWCSMAESLGWDGLKSEMEDLCFAVLQPRTYCTLRAELDRLWSLPSLAVVEEQSEEGGAAGEGEGGGGDGLGLKIVQVSGPEAPVRHYTRAAGVRAARVAGGRRGLGGGGGGLGLGRSGNGRGRGRVGESVGVSEEAVAGEKVRAVVEATAVPLPRGMGLARPTSTAAAAAAVAVSVSERAPLRSMSAAAAAAPIATVAAAAVVAPPGASSSGLLSASSPTSVAAAATSSSSIATAAATAVAVAAIATLPTGRTSSSLEPGEPADCSSSSFSTDNTAPSPSSTLSSADYSSTTNKMYTLSSNPTPSRLPTSIPTTLSDPNATAAATATSNPSPSWPKPPSSAVVSASLESLDGPASWDPKTASLPLLSNLPFPPSQTAPPIISYPTPNPTATATSLSDSLSNAPTPTSPLTSMSGSPPALPLFPPGAAPGGTSSSSSNYSPGGGGSSSGRGPSSMSSSASTFPAASTPPSNGSSSSSSGFVSVRLSGLPPAPTSPLSPLSPQQERLRLLLSTVVPFEDVGFKSLRGLASSTRRGLEVLDECAALLYDEIQIRSQAGGLGLTIQGRLKSLHSVYRKMVRKGVAVAQVYDARALRVIVDDVEGGCLREAVELCYRLVGAVHSIWKPIRGEFDDYIANPKPSGYQALHTAVRGPGGIPMEVQIKTSSMHELAEYGAAAHWVYKEYSPGVLGAAAAAPGTGLGSTEMGAASGRGGGGGGGGDGVRSSRPRGGGGGGGLRGGGYGLERLPSGYVGQPLLKVAKDKLRYGVIVAREGDGSRLVAAVKNGPTFAPFPTRVPDYTFYGTLLSYARERYWAAPGRGDLNLRLEEFVKCDDGRFHRCDHMGYLIPAETITLLEGYEEDAAVAAEVEGAAAAAAAAGGVGSSSSMSGEMAAAAAASGASITSGGGGVGGGSVDDEVLGGEGGEDQRRFREQMRVMFARTQQLRSMIEWGRDAIGKYSAAASAPSDEVCVLIWPGGQIEHFPRGTTAGDIVATKGLITTGEGPDGSGTNPFINVNNRLVAEDTILNDGDLVILAREKVRI